METPMETQDFEALAEEILESLFDALDDAIGDDVDVDLEGSILTIEFDDGRQYIINKHAASQEMWVSSPVSGAAHYRFDREAGAWVSTRDGSVMVENLAEELSAATGQAIDLT